MSINDFFLISYKPSNKKINKDPYISTLVPIRVGVELSKTVELFIYNTDCQESMLDFYLKRILKFDSWLCFYPDNDILKQNITANLNRNDLVEIKELDNKDFKKINNDLYQAIYYHALSEIKNLNLDVEEKVCSISIYQRIFAKLYQKLTEYSIDCPYAAIAKIETTFNENNIISKKDADYTEDLVMRNLRRNMVNLNLELINNMQKIFNCNLQTIFAFTKTKMVQLIYVKKIEFIIIKNHSGFLTEIDYILNFLYCDENDHPYEDDINKLILYKILNHDIIKIRQKNNYLNETDIKDLYWKNLRFIDKLLQGIMNASASKIISYCIVFKKILIFFNNTKKGRFIYILECPEKTIVPLIDLEKDFS